MYQFVFLAYLQILAITIYGSNIRLIFNNNDPNISLGDTGSWDNWMTGYHINEKHDGFLDIGSTSFNPERLNWTYTVVTNCTNSNPIFANGRIYCTASNMIVSYYPQNGSESFWYLTIGDTYVRNPTFTKYGDTSYIVAYSNYGSKITMYVIDGLSGILKNEAFLSSYYQSPYIVGSQYGDIYLTSKQSSSSLDQPYVYSYSIANNEFTEGSAGVDGSADTPTLCNNFAIVSGYYASTSAYTFQKLEYEWSWPGNGHSTSSSAPPPPVCLKNANGYRVIVKPYYTSDVNCYLLNANNGHLLDTFPCGTIPLLHYNKGTGFADIAIMGTGLTNQVIAVSMEADNIIGKELWYDNGDPEHSFMVNNYFITCWRRSSYYYNIIVYDVYTGDVKFSEETYDSTYTSSYSLFGGLEENPDDNTMYLMILLRVNTKLYAYKELVQ